MFFRFIGRVVFYGFILPKALTYIIPPINIALQDHIDKQYQKMTPEEKRRFNSVPSRRPRRTMSAHHFVAPRTNPDDALNNRFPCAYPDCGRHDLHPIHDVPIKTEAPLGVHSYRNEEGEVNHCTLYRCGKNLRDPIHNV